MSASDIRVKVTHKTVPIWFSQAVQLWKCILMINISVLYSLHKQMKSQSGNLLLKDSHNSILVNSAHLRYLVLSQLINIWGFDTEISSRYLYYTSSIFGYALLKIVQKLNVSMMLHVIIFIRQEKKVITASSKRCNKSFWTILSSACPNIKLVYHNQTLKSYIDIWLDTYLVCRNEISSLSTSIIGRNMIKVQVKSLGNLAPDLVQIH